MDKMDWLVAIGLVYLLSLLVCLVFTVPVAFAKADDYYLSLCELEGFDSYKKIGKNPNCINTFDDTQFTIEAYLIDCDPPEFLGAVLKPFAFQEPDITPVNCVIVRGGK